MKRLWTELKIWRDRTYTAEDTGHWEPDQTGDQVETGVQELLLELREPLEAARSAKKSAQRRRRQIEPSPLKSQDAFSAPNFPLTRL